MNFEEEINTEGFKIVPNVLNAFEIAGLIDILSRVESSNPVFRKSNDLFAIRQFFKHLPSAAEIVMHSSLRVLICEHFGEEYFVVKSIYFDKPPASNWFVSYHQDLTISVDKRLNTDGFGPWTVKEEQFAVQAPVSLLEDNITVRLHLDTTTKENGALKVIPGSHLKGVYRPETINWDSEEQVDCEVPCGGAMFMRPLLLHSSGRTVNQERRRVVHIEFSRKNLPGGLQWSEMLSKAAHS